MVGSQKRRRKVQPYPLGYGPPLSDFTPFFLITLPSPLSKPSPNKKLTRYARGGFTSPAVGTARGYGTGKWEREDGGKHPKAMCRSPVPQSV